ncbi:TetR/AcrR family transcriptional regulator [Actinomadura sp. DC4]|uniref:TetR/AcrR family transcriptional regulator n=1 Tax=Actinomadura sp. DC4 TaxID=3055069 RepID=UPI0025AF9531|nr:TetR/AcrR family transcriptional regulator [Actinomadura sp. DC4]MDN3355066.1 TetR/AcrR family transcriptional regulator [Actinomadura sp. DC4]
MTETTEIPPPPWRRPKKNTRQRRPLSQELIVDTAMGILDAEGIDALSMRRVAVDLRTGPASLYAHVANKDELLELMVDRVVAELEVPAPDPARWQEQIVEAGLAAHRVWTEHPGIARAALANIPVGPNSLRYAEGMLAILRAGGVPDRQAGWFIDRVSLYLLADAFEESLHHERGRTSEEDAQEYLQQIRDYFQSLPPDRFPVITSMVGTLVGGTGDERLRFGLELMVRGLASYAE